MACIIQEVAHEVKTETVKKNVDNHLLTLDASEGVDLPSKKMLEQKIDIILVEVYNI